jgi:hypothetical protein
MPTTREELKVMRKQRIVTQFLHAISKEVYAAANHGKICVVFPEPHYERAAWSEFLKEILEELEKEFPGCDLDLDEHLGITVRWD